MTADGLYHITLRVDARQHAEIAQAMRLAAKLPACVPDQHDDVNAEGRLVARICREWIEISGGLFDDEI